ncbi:tripartite tricarboxylate transporter substrate-binding protein [Rhizobium sp. 1AS11]|uniref:Bug family tripartite tricarboxylate transporter substrate binding protein n=1 Tax=Rhizobium acaciae TaxID=2989736 RepID=UPI0022225C8C|nr:tripartite tricarboxylate transporter substrate-binding protein [Rhizobium acaciae]MCW1411275.1 tripartite tricarboxylate transporter substrate-binding protein [Rhizobium acaciae]MCW1743313.1 tripartite tricarboxylate transporter substrate-binding protein [Rhizobium acaciae]
MTTRRSITKAAMALVFTALTAQVTHAQTPAEFYKGKTVTLIVSAAPGGGADLYARAFIKYFSKYLPGNPNVVINNLPGAGGLTAAGQLQNSEARDGTVVAMLQRNNLYLPLVSDEKIAFDPRKVGWLGSLNKETYALATWQNAKVKKIDDLFAQPLVIGSTSFNNENRTFPAIINQYLGAKMDIVAGYKGNDEIALAMERGEVQGRFLTVTSLMSGNDASWLKDGKINVIAQMGIEPNPAIPNVPLILNYVKNPETKALFEFMFLPLQTGRPFAAPPEVPADRLAALRKAFEDAANDKDFRAELTKQNATVELVNGLDTEAIVKTLYATPGDTIKAVKALLKPQ